MSKNDQAETSVETATKIRILISELEQDRIRADEQAVAIDREIDRMKRIQNRMRENIRKLVDLSGAAKSCGL